MPPQRPLPPRKPSPAERNETPNREASWVTILLGDLVPGEFGFGKDWIEIRIFADDVARQVSQVTCRHQLVGIVQAVGIAERGIPQANFRGTLIEEISKSRLGPGDPFGNGDSRI